MFSSMTATPDKPTGFQSLRAVRHKHCPPPVLLLSQRMDDLSRFSPLPAIWWLGTRITHPMYLSVTASPDRQSAYPWQVMALRRMATLSREVQQSQQTDATLYFIHWQAI